MALSIEQQLKMVQYLEAHQGSDRPTYAALQDWAMAEFGLSGKPSRSLVGKIIKDKEKITAAAQESMQKDRKRKRTTSANQALMEKHLLEWVAHHDSIHGGRVPLTDAMITEQVGMPINALSFH